MSLRFPTFRLRSIAEAVIIVALAVFIARLPPVRRFYAHHAPIWGAHETVIPRSPFAAQVVAGARAQIGTVYDADYAKISYPGGDVPSDRGACSDVVIRALRSAGVDLQPLIHEDLLHHPDAYPHLNATPQPDANIDHRRALIQMRYLSRHGTTLTNDVSLQTLAEWQPGDFVYWNTPGHRQHVGVLSDRVNAKSIPLVIHNGNVCLEQNCLTDWEIIGHYRLSPVNGLGFLAKPSK